MIVYCENISQKITKTEAEIRGPSVNAPEQALNGFIKSNNITKEETFIRKTDKGEFYFFKKPAQTVETKSILQKNLPKILDEISWKKSMRWGEHNLYWGRPLKSILAVFDKSIVDFNLDHLQSSNKTFVDKNLEENLKKFTEFKNYEKFFKLNNIIIDQVLRKDFIRKEIVKAEKKRKFKVNLNEKLLNEVTNLVEKPKILVCEFDKRFLNIPSEILVTTMQTHQKYFSTIDNKSNLTNNFIVVADINDPKGLVKIGNERVIDARLTDAEFFWDRNKSQNLVKQISKLKNINYFKGLGSYFDKIQRMRKLSAIISDEFLISKEKIEIASSICKVDLMSDLVAEFPELQGVMGGYFAEAQGFEKEVSLAISEHYLPLGMDSKIPKKPYSIALSLSDKIDSLVGFFGINLRPSSSKDPYALRRMAISLVRLIVENEKKIKIRDLLNYSCTLYKDQGYEFETKKIQNELSEFIIDRLKNYLKDKQIRLDIIDSSISSFGIDDLLKIYKKSIFLNKNIKKEFGLDALAIYKRSSNILINETQEELDLVGTADPGLFKNEYEKNLFKKIHEIRKYFSSVGGDENYEQGLKTLSSAKTEVNDFFNNVKVNAEEKMIKKNRLELLKMLCKSFDNYFNFSKIEV